MNKAIFLAVSSAVLITTIKADCQNSIADVASLSDVSLEVAVGASASVSLSENGITTVDALVVAFWIKGCNFGSWLKDDVGLECGEATCIDTSILDWCSNNEELCYSVAKGVFQAIVDANNDAECRPNSIMEDPNEGEDYNTFISSSLTVSMELEKVPGLTHVHENKLSTGYNTTLDLMKEYLNTNVTHFKEILKLYKVQPRYQTEIVKAFTAWCFSNNCECEKLKAGKEIALAEEEEEVEMEEYECPDKSAFDNVFHKAQCQCRKRNSPITGCEGPVPRPNPLTRRAGIRVAAAVTLEWFEKDFSDLVLKDKMQADYEGAGLGPVYETCRDRLNEKYGNSEYKALEEDLEHFLICINLQCDFLKKDE